MKETAMRYRSKPSEVEAVQWSGYNLAEIGRFCDSALFDGVTLTIEAGKDGAQGRVPVPRGHYVVRSPGDDTDYWPVEESYFEGKYEAADA